MTAPPVPSSTYEEAIRLLGSFQSNRITLQKQVERIQDHLETPPTALLETENYLHQLGYTLDQLNSLNVIHIAGTKGKGSTAAFTESIIRHLAMTMKKSIKTGLYTSPHLIEVRERIRINGTPLSRESFAKYFFEVWNQIKRTKGSNGMFISAFSISLALMTIHILPWISLFSIFRINQLILLF
ncbi:hypothetical protein HMI54_000633 [Coelomomyces lativittatus]|nr:hypothetical protein HMI54_000633 [Coelomomyces lativittatus]